MNSDGTYRSDNEGYYNANTKLLCNDVCKYQILENNVCKDGNVQDKVIVNNCNLVWTIEEDCDFGCSNGVCEPECRSDLECGSGEYCSNDFCNKIPVTNDCNTNDDCDFSQKCAYKSTGNICENLNCPYGQYIVDHACVDKPYECSNSDCREDEACVNNVCSVLRCDDNTEPKNHACLPIIECTTNEQCGNGVCKIGEKTSDNTCVQVNWFVRFLLFIVNLIKF